MNYRNLFEGINNPVKLNSGKVLIPINFDNGATTPPFKSTVNLINDNIKNYASIGRGTGKKEEYCTREFEEARNDILDFFGVKQQGEHTVIYVKSTTEGLNLLADVLMKGRKEVVLSTKMEHHANDLPWRYQCKYDYIEVDSFGRIQLEDIERKLIRYRGQIRYVTITAASNVTGYVNDINKIAALCHKYGARIIVDGAQIVAHREVNMLGASEEEQIDFLVFSAHKAYAPFGCGAIVGLQKILAETEPFLKGGGNVEYVFDDSLVWHQIPQKLEAGTQNFWGVITMAKALKDLKNIGFLNIKTHENQIKEYLLQEMKKMEHVLLYGDCDNISDRLGIISFNIQNKDYEEVSDQFAGIAGISLRSGKFCAHPYVDRLLQIHNYSENSQIRRDAGMLRLSLGLYNTMEEANHFLNYLDTLKH